MASARIEFSDLERFVDRYSLGYERGEGSQHFLRPKIPNGVLTTKQIRGLAEMASEYGRGYIEITDRQDLQLHWIDGEHAESIFTWLEQLGLTTDKCGQAYPGARYGDVRNIVGCPVAGIDREEVFDASRTVREVASFFTGNRDYLDLPRKFKMSISGCSINCTASEIQDLAFVGVRHPDGRMGFSVFAGGGVGTGPRLADPLDVFVTPENVLEVAKGFVEVYRDNGSRESKGKARFKWLVEAWGTRRLRSNVQEKIGKPLEDFEAQDLPVCREHVGVRPQKQDGYSYVTIPVMGGTLSSKVMLRLADIAEQYGWPELRLTTSQNLVFVGIRNDDVKNVVQELREVGFDVCDNPLMWTTIACAGNFCGKAPEDVKARALKIIEHLKDRFGTALQDVEARVSVSGCPNGCARHLVADIGLQAVQLKKDGGNIPAYNVYLGGVGKNRSLGTLVNRAVEADEVQFAVEKMIASHIETRKLGRTSGDFRLTTADHDSLSVSSGNLGEKVVTGG